MRVTKSSDGDTNQANAPIFTGGNVWVRALAGSIGGQNAADDADFNLAIVQFGAGARTKMHTHSSEQMLYVVSGIGKVGTARRGAHDLGRRLRDHPGRRGSLPRSG